MARLQNIALQKCTDIDLLKAMNIALQQACKPRSFASLKLRPTDRRNGVKCRATSYKCTNIERVKAMFLLCPPTADYS